MLLQYQQETKKLAAFLGCREYHSYVKTKVDKMHRLVCGEIWGGFRNCNEDVVSAGVTSTLYSSSSEGSRGGDIYYL